MSDKIYKLDAAGQRVDLYLLGRWTLSNLGDIESKLQKEFARELHKLSGEITYIIHGEAAEAVDTSAILILKKLEQQVVAADEKSTIEYLNLPVEFADLKSRLVDFDLSKRHEPRKPSVRPSDILERLGSAAVNIFKSAVEVPQLFGLFVFGLWGIIRNPSEFKLTAMMFHLQQMTIPAIAIVCAVNFMVGAVLTEQAAVRLPGFGAETLLVGFIGMVTARETSILLTGMLVAGRSSSAITAEIGSMRMNEEIDAMKVIGLELMKFLVMPRIVAMLIALPILTFFAILSGMLGSAVLLYLRYDMGFNEYIDLVYGGVTIYDLGTSMVKTPFIAISMVLVACAEGLKVRTSAASLGHHTTISVVKSLFLVIIIDSVIAIYFTQIDKF